MFTVKNKSVSKDQRGIAHMIAPLAVVLVIGIVGAFVLVQSHADSPTPLKIRLLTMTAKSVTGADAFGQGDYCAQHIPVSFKVTTSGTTDAVHIVFARDGNHVVSTLTYKGHNKWTGTGEVSSCALKKGRAAKISGLEAVASYGSSTATRTVPTKSVRLK